VDFFFSKPSLRFLFWARGREKVILHVVKSGGGALNIGLVLVSLEFTMSLLLLSELKDHSLLHLDAIANAHHTRLADRQNHLPGPPS